MSQAISIVTLVEDDEHHRILTATDDGFRVRDPQHGRDTTLGPAEVIRDVLGAFDSPGPGFFAVIDHHDERFHVGYVARRTGHLWEDRTVPGTAEKAQWQDVESELWAALSRLDRPQPESTPALDDGAS